MVFAEYRGYGLWGSLFMALNSFYDEVSVFLFVGLFDFFFGQAAQAGYFAVKCSLHGWFRSGDSSTCLTQLVA